MFTVVEVLEPYEVHAIIGEFIFYLHKKKK